MPTRVVNRTTIGSGVTSIFAALRATDSARAGLAAVVAAAIYAATSGRSCISVPFSWTGVGLNRLCISKSRGETSWGGGRRLLGQEHRGCGIAFATLTRYCIRTFASPGFLAQEKPHGQLPTTASSQRVLGLDM